MDIKRNQAEQLDTKQLEVWLTEYQACHSNRSHYESVKWTIGSIFLIGSFTLFGASFITEVRQRSIEVFLLAVFSIFLMFIWYSYVVYVSAYISKSLDRMFEIEKKLKNFEYDIGLHTSIRAEKRRIRGTYITHSFLFMVIIAWLFRLILMYDC